ncbi:hypothetical protein [uncultured Gimesia sp.]|uniref:hypothetical protein n=1 Tax=uncultured Gimesia sp. TaxID=1678688 RepID=UPI0026349251|nr:hypothetical protein [uncultured Gimesia sp.]
MREVSRSFIAKMRPYISPRVPYFWLVAILLLVFIVVIILLSRPRLKAGQVIDQFGTYRFPSGGHKLEINKTESGNVEVTVHWRTTRFYVIPLMVKDKFHTFESERDWFVSIDRYQRIWLFMGEWNKQWGKLRKMPSGGTVPYAQAVLMKGLMFTGSKQFGFGVQNVSETGDWAGVPQPFFNRIPDKEEASVWGGISSIPGSPPPFTKQQQKTITNWLRTHRM